MQDTTLLDSEIQQVVAPVPIRWRLLPWIVALVMLCIAVALALRISRMPEKAQISTRRFVISLPEPLNRTGKQQLIDVPRGENESHYIYSPNVSPDGSRIAVEMGKANDDIHVYDFSSGTLARATFEEGDERTPIWTPDGTQLAYTSEPGPIYQMFLKSVSGNSPPEPVFGSEYPRYPSSFSPDGKTLAFVENHPKTGWDIWTGPISKTTKNARFLWGNTGVTNGAISIPAVASVSFARDSFLPAGMVEEGVLPLPTVIDSPPSSICRKYLCPFWRKPEPLKSISAVMPCSMVL